MIWKMHRHYLLICVIAFISFVLQSRAMLPAADDSLLSYSLDTGSASVRNADTVIDTFAGRTPRPPYTIEGLRSRMFAQSTALAKQETEVEKAELDLAQAKAGRMPEISLQVTGTYLFNPMEAVKVKTDDIITALGTALPSAAAGSQTGEYITLMDAQEPTHYQFSLGIEQPVFTWGKISGAVELYETIAEVQRQRLEQQKRELEARFNVLLLSAEYVSIIKGTLEEQQQLAGRLVEIMQKSYESGFAVSEDVLGARIDAKQIDLALLEIEEKQSQIVYELANLAGLDTLQPADIPEFPEEWTQDILEKQFPAADDLEREAVSSAQPNMRTVELLKEVQDISVRIAKASHYWKPDLGLQIDMGYSGPRFPFVETDWYRQNDYDFNVTVALQTTVWDGGKKLKDTALSRQDAAAAEIDITAAKREIRKKLRESLLKFKLQRETAAYKDLQIEHAKNRLNSQRRQFELGSGSEADVIQQQLNVGEKLIERSQAVIEAGTQYYTILTMTGR